MTLDVEAELRPLRDATRSFLDRQSSSAEVHRIASEGPTLDRTYWSTVAELGWTSLLVPEEAGGGTVSGRPFADLAVLAHESGRHVAPGPLAPSNVVAWILSRSSVAEHADAVAAILEGRTVATWALAEGGQLWDPSSVSAHAERTDDGYVISGTKRFVEAAADADLFLVTGRLDGELAHFLVGHDAPGVVVKPQRALDPTRGYGTVDFGSVAVPATSRVGGDSPDDRLTETAFCAAIAIQAAETVGIMQRVFELTIDWVGQRVAFGRVLASYQALKHRLAEHLLRLETAAGVAAALAAALDEGSPSASRLASTAKVYIGDQAVTLVQDAIQMHGGIGVTWEHDLHLYLRRASTNRVIYGDPAEHRERLCRLAGV